MLDRAAGGSAADAGWREPAHCRFELSPPRHFVFPAILLLLSEKPRHGYRLIDPILGLGFGSVDRPTVYRALADLERDGLLESWDAEPTAGATRHVYAVTAAGRTALEHWMRVLAAERDELERLINRYTQLDHRLPSPPPPEIPVLPPRPLALAAEPEGTAEPSRPADAGEAPAPVPCRFEVSPERSAIMIRARSNVGTIEFGTCRLGGFVDVGVRDGKVDTSAGVTARLEVDVASLTSGNSLYDAELMHRVHARMFPTAVVELDDTQAIGAEDRFRVTGRLTFHGVTAAVEGAVSVGVLGDTGLVVSGEKVIDIRDFEIDAPAILMLKIYPDVRVFLHLEATA